MKYILAIALLLGVGLNLADAQTQIGFYARTDCSSLSTPVTNGVVCLQLTTTGGRTAGREYYWNGAAWAPFPAAAIANTPSGNLAATDVQAALDELQTDIDTRAAVGGTNFFTNDNTFEDGDGFKIGNAADGTRRFRFDASGISGGATRTYVAPDSNGTLALTTSNVASATALASNPVDCAAQGAYADTIAANGDLTCDILIVTSTNDPTADDDTGDGYIVGTRWINTTDDTEWVAVDVTAATAVWQCTTCDGTTPGLTAVMTVENTYYGATSPATGMIVGKDSNHYGVWYYDETEGLKFECVELGVVGDCNKDVHLNSGFSRSIFDSSGQAVWRLSESTGRVTFPTASKQPLKTVYLDAGSFSTDGTQCAAPAEAALNTNKPKTWSITCTDNDAGRMTAKVTMPASWNGGTIRVRPSWFSQDSVATNIVQSWFGQCVRDGDAVADVATTGEQNATLTFESEANETQKAFTAAITLQGTCAGGATIFLTGDIDATGTTYVTMANARFLGVQIEYGISGESD